MGTTPLEKRHKPLGGQWKLLDIIFFTMMAALVILLMLIFTSLGDSLAASGQRDLDAAIRADSTSSGESCVKLTACVTFRACAEAICFGEDIAIRVHMNTSFGKGFISLAN